MKAQPTDKEIISQVLKGDLRAYSDLVDRYQHMVFTLALRMLRNRPLAEETAQDVFLKAYKALKGFQGQSKFSTWLYKIAYHRILDVSDRENRRKTVAYLDSDGFREAGAENDTWASLMREERGKLVRQVLDGLEQEDRAVLSLFYLQDLTLKEVGDIMELKPGTVKVRLHRARQRLKAKLEENQAAKIIQNYGS